MVRLVLLSWVLLSVPFCVLLGRMIGAAKSTPVHRSRQEAHEIAHMLTRSGFHPER